MHIISHTKYFFCSFHTQVLSSSQLPHASYRMNSFTYVYGAVWIAFANIDGKI